MTRLAILAFLIGVFFFIIRSYFAPKKEKEKEPEKFREPEDSDAAEMVQDPNCETYIPKRDALPKLVNGTYHYFCGETCAEEFVKKSEEANDARG